MTHPYNFNAPPPPVFDPTNINPLDMPGFNQPMTAEERRTDVGRAEQLQNELGGAHKRLVQIDQGAGRVIVNQAVDWLTQKERDLGLSAGSLGGDVQRDIDRTFGGHETSARQVQQRATAELQDLIMDSDTGWMMDNFVYPSLGTARTHELGAGRGTVDAARRAQADRAAATASFGDTIGLHRRHQARPLPAVPAVPRLSHHFVEGERRLHTPAEAGRRRAEFRTFTENNADRQQVSDEHEARARQVRAAELRTAADALREGRPVGSAPAEMAAQDAQAAANRAAQAEQLVLGWSTETGRVYGPVITEYASRRAEVEDHLDLIGDMLDNWPLGADPTDPQDVADIHDLFDQLTIRVNALSVRDSARAEALLQTVQARYRFEARRVAAGLADGTHGYRAAYAGRTYADGERAIRVVGASGQQILYEDGSMATVEGGNFVRRTTDGRIWHVQVEADQTPPAVYEDRYDMTNVQLRTFAIVATNRWEATLDPAHEVEARSMNYAWAERLDEDIVEINQYHREAVDNEATLQADRATQIRDLPRLQAELHAAITDATDLANALHDLQVRHDTAIHLLDTDIVAQRAAIQANIRMFEVTTANLSATNAWLARLEVTAPAAVRALHGNRTAQMLPNGNVQWNNANLHGITGTWEVGLDGNAQLLDSRAGTRTLYDPIGRVLGTRPL